MVFQPSLFSRVFNHTIFACLLTFYILDYRFIFFNVVMNNAISCGFKSNTNFIWSLLHLDYIILYSSLTNLWLCIYHSNYELRYFMWTYCREHCFLGRGKYKLHYFIWVHSQCIYLIVVIINHVISCGFLANINFVISFNYNRWDKVMSCGILTNFYLFWLWWL